MIEGVILKNLKTHNDDRGFFREIFRFESEFPDKAVGQMSHSYVKTGIIKGWHGHHKQSQWNYVLMGKVKVVLFDYRSDSNTFGNLIEFNIDDEGDSKAYFFPPGILHGYQCIQGPMHIIYVTSGCYDLSDEVRFPMDNSLIPYIW